MEETLLVRSAASDPSTTFLSTGYSTATSVFYLATTGTSAANGEVTIASTFAAGSLVVVNVAPADAYGNKQAGSHSIDVMLLLLLVFLLLFLVLLLLIILSLLLPLLLLFLLLLLRRTSA